MSELFGKFVLERKLAVGGMAEIFLATNQGPEGFKKHLAIKRILPHLTDDSDFVTMFLDEARLVARFNHPNIVQIFELGQVDGRYFLAMEFVNGVSMSKLIKACRKNDAQLPLEYGAKIISYACEGLDYAHTFSDAGGTPLNLIHRDVSPQNLMLSYDGVVKVLDFGIAKASGNIYQTRTSSLKGKAAYMSPEQITQKTGLDRRSDIFSLGIVLFEFATGRRPYSGDTELELMMAIVQRPAPDPRELNELVPEDLAGIIGRALAKDRQQRYQSCRELRMDLEEFLISRRMLVDNYALGAMTRELIPPSETGVGYSVPTPSRPSLVGQAGLQNTPSPRRTPTGQRQPPPVGDASQDAPTQMTPSSQLRPLIEGALAESSPPGASPLVPARPAPSAQAEWPSAERERPRGESGRRVLLGLVILLLVAVTGAGAAFLLFGDAGPGDGGKDAGVALASTFPGGASDPAEPPDAGGQPAPVDAGVGVEPDQADPQPATVAPAPQREPNRKKRRTSKRKTKPVVAVESRPEPSFEPVKPDAGVAVARVESPGKLVIDTRPWTNVSIDGTAYGTTPVGPVELRPGVHQVVLSNKAKGIRMTRTIRILAGQTQRVQEKFGEGLAQVFVKPFGEVFVNGVSKGMTPLGAPLKLYEGSHAIKVVCSRTGKQENRNVRIKAGETVKLIFDLR